MKKLENKVAIVTGASRGIGAHIAIALASLGAKVLVNYAGNQSAAEHVVEAIRSAGGEALTIRADVSSAADVKAMFDAAIEQYGKVDILINNAGIALYKRIEDTTDEDFDRVLAINLRGVFLTLREAARRLEMGGRIISFSSSTTRLMLPTYGVYSASKAAVEQMTRVFAKEVGARGITVNAIAPGPTNTELFNEGKTPETIQRLASMSALGRIGEPEDIARVVLFLVGEEAGWISGQTIAANGGFA